MPAATLRSGWPPMGDGRASVRRPVLVGVAGKLAHEGVELPKLGHSITLQALVNEPMDGVVAGLAQGHEVIRLGRPAPRLRELVVPVGVGVGRPMVDRVGARLGAHVARFRSWMARSAG